MGASHMAIRQTLIRSESLKLRQPSILSENFKKKKIMNYQEKIRPLVRGYYDIQKLRIQFGNRVCSTFKVKIGIKPGQKEDIKDKKKILDIVKCDFELLSNGTSEAISLKKFKGQGIISDYTEYCLAGMFIDILRNEERHMKKIQANLKGIPIYESFLKNIIGVGPAMAGVCISEIDITKAFYPSSLWKYAGLDVCSDGFGRSRKVEHLEDFDYINKKGELATKKGITFNPFLKTKLIGVLAGSFIKQPTDKCIYRVIYDNYKNRLENHPRHKEKTKGHRDNMAKRYTIKRFLVDLYKVWRTLEDLPVAPEYSEKKLEMQHK
jgi:6-pyruvoyl-tetrahydropterin synthase